MPEEPISSIHLKKSARGALKRIRYEVTKYDVAVNGQQLKIYSSKMMDIGIPGPMHK
jgi:hypothetical protein